MKRLKYLLAYLVPLALFISLNTTGVMTFISVFIFFGFLPLLEFFIEPDKENMEAKIAHDEKHKAIYDWILYLSIPMQIMGLVYFLFVIQDTPFGSIEYFGRITAMGMMCGVIGINVGHELGHRHKRWEQFLGEILLMTSLNAHFLPYHNGGHHLNVATPKDSATAVKNEWLFTFWFTSHFGSYREAWRLENRLMRSKNKSIFSLNNRMVVYSIVDVILISSIFYFFGLYVMIAFILAAIFGILLLETVNYIEHYGLLREKNEKGRYKRVEHHHSWNSDHPIGRAVLFNLSRHSDHHYNGSIKYQVLKSIETSPQMPTGYPGMMVLALIPPLWFKIMNKKIEEINRKSQPSQKQRLA